MQPVPVLAKLSMPTPAVAPPLISLKATVIVPSESPLASGVTAVSADSWQFQRPNAKLQLGSHSKAHWTPLNRS